MQSILIVDDIAENLYFLEVVLKGNGFEVHSATNGVEALESARNTPPDLIVSDILMPVMDGYMLCKEWHNDERLKQIPFMFYTATFVEKKDEHLALSLGADRFIIKPQEPEILMEIIRDVLARSRSKTVIPLSHEKELLTGYNDALFRKLEKKMADLELVNQELLKSEQNFKQFVMQCPIPIAISDFNGKIELFNNCFVEVLGYTLDDIPQIDSWWLKAYPDQDYRNTVSEAWQKAMETALQGGGNVRCADEHFVTCKNGTVRTMEIYGTPIANRLLTIFNDLTERRRAEKEKTYLQAQMVQQDKMASIGQLAAGIVHEINSPIGFIKSNLETMSKHIKKLKNYLDEVNAVLEQNCDSEVLEKLAKKQKDLRLSLITGDLNELLSDSSDGAERIITTIQGLKIFSHPDELEEKQVDINICLDTVLRIIRSEIRYVATLKRESSELPLVTCNSQQISQVMMNLLVNAAHAIEGYGEITVRTWAEKDMAFFSVTDSGCGIPPENIGKIFDAFFTTKEIGKGTGLGLSISYDIVKKHGGEITVESEVGKGTTFTVRLPVSGVGSQLPQACDVP